METEGNLQDLEWSFQSRGSATRGSMSSSRISVVAIPESIHDDGKLSLIWHLTIKAQGELSHDLTLDLDPEEVRLLAQLFHAIQDHSERETCPKRERKGV